MCWLEEGWEEKGRKGGWRDEEEWGKQYAVSQKRLNVHTPVNVGGWLGSCKFFYQKYMEEPERERKRESGETFTLMPAGKWQGGIYLFIIKISTPSYPRI